MPQGRSHVKLPNAENVVVESAKIVDYLLSDTHEDGRHKSAFFRSFGFQRARWAELRDALRKHASDHDVATTEPSPFGQRYVVDGIMQMPDGRTPLVRSVWFVRSGESVTCFVTAYPLKKKLSELSDDEGT
jgi:hypothetical protein